MGMSDGSQIMLPGWARPGSSHAEKAEREASVRLWVHTAHAIINENLQIQIGEDGVEISVINLTDMPNFLDWGSPWSSNSVKRIARGIDLTLNLQIMESTRQHWNCLWDHWNCLRQVL